MKEEQGSEKSRLVTLILCVLLGWAGGHRFYCNKIGTGLIMLFTGGGMGLWVFIDFVMIILGAFKDKENLAITKW
ncbi:MAG: TM2 domain-containing protein [Candidatus Magnetobacterium sp. LHC-1]|nr:TM2 domain-containing protein [Nitrospirota bacterium]MBF0608406.1 TM2 domain-containing protein [Nitrospirota bacterium]